MDKESTETIPTIDDVLNLVRWGDYEKQNGNWARGIANREEIKSQLQRIFIGERLDELGRIYLASTLHSKSVGLWDMKALVLDELAMKGELSQQQKDERDTIVTERRAMRVLEGIVKENRQKLKDKLQEETDNE